MTINQRRRRPKHATSCSFFCRFDSAPCLLWANGWDPFQPNQGLKIFPLCRQDCPLPPPINKSGFHGLREENIESKYRKKPASPLFLFSLFPRQPSTALSTSPQLPSPARTPTNPAYTSPRTLAPPQEASTTTKQPPWLSLPSPSSLSLSSANFFFLRSRNSGGQALHQRCYQHDHRPSLP